MMTSVMSRCAVFAASLSAFAFGAAAETQRGVTDNEILIGTITDLSGVTAVQGVNNANAVRLAFDDVNAQGGINGRKIRYIVEDSQYQVPRAVQAINKLINSDGVFMTIENGGTPMNNAIYPMAIEKNMLNLLPLSAARSMYEPFNKLKFSQYSSYVDEMRAGVNYFVEQRGKKTICAMYQDTDFGKDVFAGAQLQAEAMGMKIVATTAHKPTDTDFSAAIAKLREANCDLIAMGTIVERRLGHVEHDEVEVVVALGAHHLQGSRLGVVEQVGDRLLLERDHHVGRAGLEQGVYTILGLGDRLERDLVEVRVAGSPVVRVLLDRQLLVRRPLVEDERSGADRVLRAVLGVGQLLGRRDEPGLAGQAVRERGPRLVHGEPLGEVVERRRRLDVLDAADVSADFWRPLMNPSTGRR